MDLSIERPIASGARQGGNAMPGFDERREQVLDGCARAFAVKGYQGASIRDIARAVPMSAGGLYHYCSNKQEFLYQVCDRAFRSLIERLTTSLEGVDDPAERVHTVFKSHLTYFLERPDELITLTEDLSSLEAPWASRVRVLQRSYYGIVTDVLAPLEAPGGISLRVATMSLFGMINWVHTWYRRGADPGADALARQMSDLFLSGFAPAATAPKTASRAPQGGSER